MTTNTICADARAKSPRLVRALLASTCLTAAGGSTASAATIIEGAGGAPVDFTGASPGDLLPVGTNIVQGTKLSQADDDWFEFQGLVPGSPFSLTAFFVPSGAEVGLRVNLFDTSNNSLGTGSLEGGGAALVGTVPGDGRIRTQIASCNCFNDTGAYEVDLTASADVPEPATLGTVGLALAGGLAWRRRRRS